MSLLIKHFCRFGEFTVDTEQKVLFREGRPVPLTPKVFDTLLVLVENSGRIIGKDELMNRLWPDSFVEEANLACNIQQLRKGLGDNARKPSYIETVARRGYRFIANVEDIVTNSERMTDGQRTGTGVAWQCGASDDKESKDLTAPECDRSEQQPVPLVGLAEKISEAKTPMAEVIADSAAPFESQISNLQCSSDRQSDGASRSRRRRKRVVFGIRLLALVGIGILLYGGFWTSQNKSFWKDARVDTRRFGAIPVAIEKLTGTGQSSHVAISRDGRYVAYTISVKTTESVWLRQLSTNTNVEIVPPTGSIYGLAVSGRGEYLYFVRGNPTALYRVPLVGGVPTRILDRLEGNFSLSPDDSQVAFIRQAINRDGQREYSLMVAGSDGGGERTLLVGTHPNRLDVPVWSPDGQSIICAHGNWDSGSENVTIAEVNVSNGKERDICQHKFFRIKKMAWLPHKSGLIISGAKTSAIELWLLSFPGMELRQVADRLISYNDLAITDDASQVVASQAGRISDLWVGTSQDPQGLKKTTQAIDGFCWTPDGRLVYSSSAGGNTDLWMMGRDGTGQRQLTVNTGWNGRPAITSDSRYIVFISNRTGEFQVWRMNPDGSDQIQLTNATGANFLAISTDDKWAFYNSTDNWHLWKVPIEGGEPVPVTQFFAVFPSVSPDGKRIACLGRDESKSQLLVIPIDEGQPLKRIDLAGGIFSGNRIEWGPDGKSLIYPADRNGATALIKQSLVGGSVEEIARFDEGDLFDFGYSFNERFLAVTRGGWQHDAVLIKGLNLF